MAKKAINFGTANKVQPVVQVQDEKGKVSEKTSATSTNVDKKFISELKIFCIKKGTTQVEFFKKYASMLINNEFDYTPYKTSTPYTNEEMVKITIPLPESLQNQLKIWNIANEVTLRDLLYGFLQHAMKQ